MGFPEICGDVVGANGVLTVHLAPHQILAALSVEFEDNPNTSQIDALVIKPQTAGRFRDVLHQQRNQYPKKTSLQNRRSRAADAIPAATLWEIA